MTRGLLVFAAVTDAFRVSSDVSQNAMTNDWWGSDYHGPRFIDATEMAGLTNSASSFGTNFIDIDADGDLDLYVSQTGSPNRLYLNVDGKGNFSDITVSSGLLDPSASRGASFADVNGDGHLDLYQTNTDIPNRLYLGDGKGHFERQFDTGLEDTGMAQVACFGDIDNDGDLDLFFTNQDKSNLLYLNNGRGTFTEATEAAGLASAADSGGFQCEFGDMDNDGDLDLIVANTVASNYYYVNDGTGNFVERAEEAGVVGEEGISSGMRIGDFNGDGHLDLFCGSLVSGNHLYINDGTGHFVDTIEAAGLGDLGILTPGSNWADVDGDGDLDLLQGRVGFAMRLYENDGNAVFTENSEAGLGFHLVPHGIAFGDVDGDGDLDAYINTWDFILGARQANRLLINQGEPAYKWLKVRPVNENRHATLVGAQVRLFEAGTQMSVGVRRHTDGGHCFGSQDAYDVYFGLSEFPDSTFDVEVRCGGSWITKASQPELGNVAPNQVIEAKCPRSL
jgi:hypothetical protein